MPVRSVQLQRLAEGRSFKTELVPGESGHSGEGRDRGSKGDDWAWHRGSVSLQAVMTEAGVEVSIGYSIDCIYQVRRGRK